MTRIVTPALDTATGATADVYAQIKKAAGKVPNTFATIGAHGPQALQAVLAADGVLAGGSLSKQEQEIVKLVTSEVVQCDYCISAHSLLGKLTGLSLPALKQLRDGQPTGDARHDALAHFVRHLVGSRGTISQGQFEAIRAAGFTDQQLVEISLAIAVTTFTNIFNRINDTANDLPAVD